MTKSTKLFFILLLCFTLFDRGTLYSQKVENFSINGNWSGEISVGANIEMIFKVWGVFTIEASLDVPIQGAKNIPVSVEDRIDKVKFMVKSINGMFEGTKIDSITIDGYWKQNGGSYPMRLKKNQTTKAIADRPQTPKPPFPYKVEEVLVQGPVGKLGGTLTIPEGKGPFPAIVLATGSGQQDRDETIFNHKPFWVIADAFTKAGYAVLRMDDRGVGASEGNPEFSTTKDFADDCYAGVKYLQNRSDIQKKNIGLLGHSEGATIGQIVASAHPKEIACLISMAGPAISGYDILVSQTRVISSKQMLPEMSLRAVNQQKTILSMIMHSKDSVLLQKQLTDSLGAWAVEQQKVFIANTPEFKAQLKQLQSPWLKYFLQYQPTEYLQKIKCPILAINGSEDIQVIADENLPVFETMIARTKNKKSVVKKYEGLNHLFQQCNTCGVEEYMTIQKTIEDDVLKYMISWMQSLKK